MSETDLPDRLFKYDTWFRSFDRATLGRARHYASQGRVTLTRLQAHHVEATCEGSAGQRYTQSIEISSGRDFTVMGACS